MDRKTRKYLAFWRDHFSELEAESQRRSARARADLPAVVEILRKHGAKRIYLFGSLCHPGRFQKDSDIDIAVEGIPARRFIRASADVAMAMDWPIDLKPLEELDELMRSTILQKGELLYAE